MSNKADRYQYQPWYIKLWRRRHYIPIPLVAARIYLATRKSREGLPFRAAWSIAIGLAQVKMNWLHDWDEIRKRLDNSDLDALLREAEEGSDGTV